MADTIIQKDPGLNRRYRLAEALMAQGQDASPIRHPLQGFARLAQTLAGGYQAGKVEDEARAREEARRGTLARALSASQTGVKPWTNPDTGQQAIQGAAPGYESLIQVLAGNPDTADQAADLGIQLAGARAEQAMKPPDLQTIKMGDQEVTGFYRNGEFVPVASAPRFQEDRTMVEVYDPESPTGTRMVPRSEAAGRPGKPGSGLDVQFGDDGRVTGISTGRKKTGADMQTKTRSTLEDKILTSQEALARLNRVRESFDPRFLEYTTRLGSGWWSDIKEKAGFELGPEERQAVEEFSAFQLDTIDNLNRYIKEITGAQMSEAEAARLTKGVPNMDDGPTKFKSKLDRLTDTLRMATARYTFMLNNGVTEPGKMQTLMPLEKVPQTIDERGEQLAQEFIEQGMEPAAAENAAVEQLRREFGL